jgi:macrodomain Ter protein organizer (MatP/YcbG family)
MEKIKTSIVYPYDLWKRLRKVATEERRPVNDVVVNLLEAALKETEQK